MSDSSDFEAINAIEAKAEDLEKQSTLVYMNKGSRRFTTFDDSLYGFDTIRNSIIMPETEGHGFTFFTRPKLNLSTPSIRADRILSMLDTFDPETVAFAIRATLDTKLRQLYNLSVSNSQFFNPINPFISILSNRLISLNGWPDPTLDVETTDGGYFSESITYPKGHDQLTRNYDLAATFSDIQGSVVHNLFMMWMRWIHLTNRGITTAYMEDIENRRMCFTSAIYRFVMDPSNRYITKWAKATGCFPRSTATGAYFNYDSAAGHTDVAMNLSIPVTVAGKIEYMDPIIFKEFNMCVDKLSRAGASFRRAHNKLRVLLNFRCIPYIDLSGTNELIWLYDPSDGENQRIIQESGYTE